ncbi:MAG: hypothetical protein RI883_1266 [Bacteroidota bacterium]
MLKICRFLFCYLVLFWQLSISIYGQTSQNNTNISQNPNPHILFKKSEIQQFGFDEYLYPEWSKYYDTLETEELKDYKICYKSVGYKIADNVDAIIQNINDFEIEKLDFVINGKTEKIRFTQKNDSTLTLFLPRMAFKYYVSAKYDGKKIGQLNVVVYAQKTENVIVVPLMDTKLNRDSLELYINSIFSQANVYLKVRINPIVKLKEVDLEELYDNPSPTNDRFTNQMREFRDAYFETYPNADKNAYYIFIIPGFVNPKINGFMVQNKAVGFIKNGERHKMEIAIARQLGFGVGALQNSWLDKGPRHNSTRNLMDENGGIELNHFQWENLRHSCHSYSFFDNYEDVKTNSGLVAYYFWEEDGKGNILMKNNDFLLSLKRPYKKNFVSYHLNINDFFFQIRFKIGDYLICLWHIISFLIILIGSFLLRKRFNKFLVVKMKNPRFWKFLARLGFIAAGVLVYFLTFLLINKGYEQFEVKVGILQDLKGQTFKQAKQTILTNENLKFKNQSGLSSEMLIKRKDNWFVKRKKKVLYFELRQDEKSNWNRCKYVSDSDSLILSNFDFRHIAQSHYFVVNYIKNDGTIIDQKVYNHLGNDLTTKMNLSDPAKRILLFVNGYRPTSMGNTFEDNFKDILEKGLEYSNSSNMIYNFDRYDYWRPWQEIDLLFQKRINPSETYYADGHFSVSTSNHKSLINFSSTSSIYPKRCSNKKKHVCYYTKVSSSGIFSSKTIKTVELHKVKPNKDGFRERRENGRTAGKNLLLLFNELPNKSVNDTLYVVAHSMGYAYSLGIIEVLRGRINFGGFYILAPENASCGDVILTEWKEIWQYGSKFQLKGGDAPCLLDGVAPQTKVGGLPNKNRAYIPSQYYKKKGFFDSHFVGYYTWVFDIQKGKAGNITQR